MMGKPLRLFSVVFLWSDDQSEYSVECNNINWFHGMVEWLRVISLRKTSSSCQEFKFIGKKVSQNVVNCFLTPEWQKSRILLELAKSLYIAFHIIAKSQIQVIFSKEEWKSCWSWYWSTHCCFTRLNLKKMGTL